MSVATMKQQIKILEILKDMRSLRSEREQAATQGKAEVFFLSFSTSFRGNGCTLHTMCIKKARKIKQLGCVYQWLQLVLLLLSYTPERFGFFSLQCALQFDHSSMLLWLVVFLSRPVLNVFLANCSYRGVVLQQYHPHVLR